MTGMKINYDKSDLLTIGTDEERVNEFARIFCCETGEFPLKYLGVPLHFTKLRREDLQPIIDNIIKRIARWKGRLLSYAGRLTLLKACLASIPIYLMSIIKFPRWAIDMINSHMARFLWNNSEDKHKYHLTNRQLVAQKKELGGLGIPDLRNLNLSLLSSWIFRSLPETVELPSALGFAECIPSDTRQTYKLPSVFNETLGKHIALGKR